MSMLFDVSDKTVLVTGGASGIGRMIAEGFVAAGADVLITSRKADAAEAAATELSAAGRCVALVGDLATEVGVDALAAEVRMRRSILHVLVNNAGATWGAAFPDYPMSGFDRAWAVNVKAPYGLTQALYPLLAAAATPNEPSRVINIGSTDGVIVPVSENYGYSASKAAIHHLTRHLAARLARDNITVNAMAPGLFHTKMTHYLLQTDEDEARIAEHIPLSRVGRGSDIAGSALFLASRAGAYTTGALLPVDGGVGTTRQL